MGDLLSTMTNPVDVNHSQLRESSPTKSNSPNSSPSSSYSTTASTDMNTSNTQTHFSGSETSEVETSTEGISSSELKEDSNKSKENEDGEEVEGECPFCLFMKGGGCKDAFIAWEDCVQEAEDNKEDIVEKCHKVTGTLTKCMQAHADYYEPILQAEKAAKEELVKEMDKEKSTNETESNAAESEIEIVLDFS